MGEAYFNGYKDFDYRKKIWGGVFGNYCEKLDQDDTALKRLLSITAELGHGVFGKKLNGKRAWAEDGRTFLSLQTNDKLYKSEWLDKILQLNLDWNYCEQVLYDFTCAVPDGTYDSMKYPAFVRPGQVVKSYLEEVIRCCESASKEVKKIWIAGGIYSVICLVMQNVRDAENEKIPILFYRPPVNFDPNPDWQPEILTKESRNIKVPDMEFSQDDISSMPVDLFALAHEHFEKRSRESSPVPAAGKTPGRSMITPAEIRRKRVPFSAGLSYKEEVPENVRNRYFLVEENLVCEKPQWYLQKRLSPIPFHKDGIIDFLVNTTAFADDYRREIVQLNVHRGTYRCELLQYIFGKNTLQAVTAAPFSCVEFRIGEHGHLRDLRMEEMLFSLQIKNQPGDTFVSFRTVTVDLCREYLQYQFFDLERMQELPVLQSQNQRTGGYQLSLEVPCPGRIAVIRNHMVPLAPEEATLYHISGLFQGLYGLEEDPEKAVDTLFRTDHQNPQFAFQHGAYLRTIGFSGEAEKLLRRAGELAGARFELAELLLKEKGTPEAMEEAEGILDELWEQGYRSYGAQTSIDLLNKYPQPEEKPFRRRRR